MKTDHYYCASLVGFNFRVVQLCLKWSSSTGQIFKFGVIAIPITNKKYIAEIQKGCKLLVGQQLKAVNAQTL